MPVASDSASPVVNVAAHLDRMARQWPNARALGWSVGSRGYRHWTFRELNEETNRYAHGLRREGIGRGTRTILMVRPSTEFFALTFALFRIGAVPVLIDPGMGREKMAECLAGVEAEAFIGIPLAHIYRLLHSKAFRGIKVYITAGRRWCWGGLRLRDIRSDEAREFEIEATRGSDPAAIIFTTGSTGPPKGVLYRHSNFDAQVRILREHFGVRPGEVDLPTFPLFALFAPALGMTAVIPDMDFTRPGFVDPARIIRAINDQSVTHMFGSPALLDRVGRYGQAHGVKLRSLRRVISAGAAVPPVTLERYSCMLPDDAEIHTPYGATEALPVASITGREILGGTRKLTDEGRGTCVGRPIPSVTARIIGINDGPIPSWDNSLVLKDGEIGEIVVKGPVVTTEYFWNPTADELAKIRDGDDIWHRMGDVGYLDDQGRLWFCGRKAHRVVTKHGTLFTEPCESIFNQHPKIRRTALVGVGHRPRQTPVICFELEDEALVAMGGELSDTLCNELFELAGSHEMTRIIGKFLWHPSFPVDIRHNSKIFREKLAVWAAEQLR